MPIRTVGPSKEGVVDGRLRYKLVSDKSSQCFQRHVKIPTEPRPLPALIAEYQTQLPDKKMLRAKLHEFYLQNNKDKSLIDS